MRVLLDATKIIWMRLTYMNNYIVIKIISRNEGEEISINWWIFFRFKTISFIHQLILEECNLKSLSFEGSLILQIHYWHENIIYPSYGLIFPTERVKPLLAAMHVHFTFKREKDKWFQPTMHLKFQYKQSLSLIRYLVPQR